MGKVQMVQRRTRNMQRKHHMKKELRRMQVYSYTMDPLKPWRVLLTFVK